MLSYDGRSLGLTKENAEGASKPKPSPHSNNAYQEWIEKIQKHRNKNWQENVALHNSEDTELPPPYSKVTLFHEGVEDYAIANTKLVSEDVQDVARSTNDSGLFAPCMVGTLESQFLRMQVEISGAKRILDIGTFTGMSALAMAEGLRDRDGSVVTLEWEDEPANVAFKCFANAKCGHKIRLIRGCAMESMKKLAEEGHKFDMVFMDADKENYINYYKQIMDGGLLAKNGFILADNTLCALLYDTTDSRSKNLHDFNQFVKNDERVDQVILTIREGITMIKPKSRLD